MPQGCEKINNNNTCIAPFSAFIHKVQLKVLDRLEYKRGVIKKRKHKNTKQASLKSLAAIYSVAQRIVCYNSLKSMQMHIMKIYQSIQSNSNRILFRMDNNEIGMQRMNGWFRCVWLELELNFAGWSISRNRVWEALSVYGIKIAWIYEVITRKLLERILERCKWTADRYELGMKNHRL